MNIVRSNYMEDFDMAALVDPRDPKDPTHLQHQRTYQTMRELTAAIATLTVKLDNFMTYTQNSVPLKSMYLIFVLVFALIFGIEGVQFLFKTWLPKLLN